MSNREEEEEEEEEAGIYPDISAREVKFEEQ